MSLQLEVDRFKKWADLYPLDERYGEWECDYQFWGELHAAALEFVSSYGVVTWSEENVRNVIYVVARDNEIEYLADEIGANEDLILMMAEASITSEETDAKWQFAEQLGRTVHNVKEAEALLLRYVDDKDEYVSRRALLALGKLKSSKAECLAERAWESGHEYQRIAALWVLKDVGSEKLKEYIQKARQDGRKYVVKNALEVAGA